MAEGTGAICSCAFNAKPHNAGNVCRKNTGCMSIVDDKQDTQRVDVPEL